jgi:Winged helix DNA-binding domain
MDSILTIKRKLTTSGEISNARLQSQKIEATEFNTAREIVSWMGAMQAQDYSMAKWAIGTRLSDPSDQRIESSIDKGEIIRIHVLRPTWHFISAEDVYWMLQLSIPKLRSATKSRHKQLGLTESVISKTEGILEKALSNGLNLTRDELADKFHKSGIQTDGNRLSHILFRAELDGIVCSGPTRNNKPSYSLLYERIPRKKDLSRDEALAELAKRYFTSRCPATLEDFIWWSNLSVTDARKAIDFVKSDFFPETTDRGKYWLPYSFSGKKPHNTSVHLLPAFDEFLISYKNRSCSLSLINNKKTVSDNGIFHPFIVVNGQVTGLWKRTIKKNKVIIETELFQTINKLTRNMIDKKASSFGKFLAKEIEVVHNSNTARGILIRQS